eukprot:scaffold6007_cov183-Amphora_coffeaeformis.AAC.4
MSAGSSSSSSSSSRCVGCRRSAAYDCRSTTHQSYFWFGLFFLLLILVILVNLVLSLLGQATMFQRLRRQVSHRHEYGRRSQIRRPRMGLKTIDIPLEEETHMAGW